jgi:hypothetical protein
VLVGLRPPAGTERLDDHDKKGRPTLLMPSQACERGCLNKRRYATKKDAKRSQAYARSLGAEALRIYRCPFCNGFHAGHPNANRWEFAGGGLDAA